MTTGPERGGEGEEKKEKNGQPSVLRKFVTYSNESIHLIIQHFYVYHTSNREEKKHKEKEMMDFSD